MDESRKIQKEVNPEFPLLDDVENKAGNIFNVKGIPTIFVIGKNGNVADAITPDMINAGLEKRLTAVFESLK